MRAGPRSRSSGSISVAASSLFPVSAASGAYPDSSSPGCCLVGLSMILGAQIDLILESAGAPNPFVVS